MKNSQTNKSKKFQIKINKKIAENQKITNPAKNLTLKKKQSTKITQKIHLCVCCINKIQSVTQNNREPVNFKIESI
jgi:hypothetical protein